MQKVFSSSEEMAAALEAAEAGALALVEAGKAEGNTAFKAKDYASALSSYRAAIGHAPNPEVDDVSESMRALCTVLHSNCAEALLQLERPAEAAEAARRALALDGDHAKSAQRLLRAERAIEKQAAQEERKRRQAEQRARKAAAEKARAAKAAERAAKAKAAEEEDDCEEFFTPGYLSSIKS